MRAPCDARLIVILNDNDMSIAPPTGALSAYLARITSSGSYLFWRNVAKRLAKRLPKSWERRAGAAWSNIPATSGRAACGSRSWASTMSGRSMGTIATAAAGA